MAYGVRSHKFLCCLPVRLGVFVLSFCHFLLNAFLAIVLWVGLALKDVHLDKREKVSVILGAIHFTINGIFALFGLYGTIRRRLSAVKSYSQLLNYMLGVYIIVGIVHIIMIFTKDKQEFINDCIDGRTDQKAIDACHHVTTFRLVLVGFIVFVWLLVLYECIIVARYVLQLEEEKGEKHRLKVLSTGMYDTVPAGRESTEAFAVKFRDETGAGSSYIGAKGDVKLYGPGPHEVV
ncbi:hypothetical protein ACEPAI_8350 [Sanghuangporus weigelae]